MGYVRAGFGAGSVMDLLKKVAQQQVSDTSTATAPPPAPTAPSSSTQAIAKITGTPIQDLVPTMPVIQYVPPPVPPPTGYPVAPATQPVIQYASGGSETAGPSGGAVAAPSGGSGIVEAGMVPANLAQLFQNPAVLIGLTVVGVLLFGRRSRGTKSF